MQVLHHQVTRGFSLFYKGGLMAAQIPYSGKVWRGECLASLLFSSVGGKSFANDRPAKGLLIVTTTLDGFILVNCR